MIDRRNNQGSPPRDGCSRYEILHKIGEGGMGEVHLAQDTMLRRRVALKLLPEALQNDDTARQRVR